MSRDSQIGKSSLAGRYARPLLAVLLISTWVSLSIIWIEEPIFRRAMIVAGVCSHALAHPSCATFRSDIRPLGVDPPAFAWLWRSVSVDSRARMVSQSGAGTFSWWLRVFSQ